MVYHTDYGIAETQGSKEPWISQDVETSKTLKAQTSQINRPQEIGTYYEATVPDTLDLAQRAKLGVNHLVSIISEENGYDNYARGDFEKQDYWTWPGAMQCLGPFW